MQMARKCTLKKMINRLSKYCEEVKLNLSKSKGMILYDQWGQKTWDAQFQV